MQSDADAQPTAEPLAPSEGTDPLQAAPEPPPALPAPITTTALVPEHPAEMAALPMPLGAPEPPAPILGALPAPLVPPLAPHAAARPRGPASLGSLVVITLASLAADLATKAWAKTTLSGFHPKPHDLRRLEDWKGHIDFIFAQNPGGAWSFLRNLPDSLRRPFFLVVSAGAIVFIITIYQRVHRDQWAMRLGLPLALGGAAGNLVDRIRYGWVVDFIDFSMTWGGREHHWPTFNVADVAIVIGVALMAIDMLRARGLHAHDAHAIDDGGSAAKPAPAVSPLSS